MTLVGLEYASDVMGNSRFARSTSCVPVLLAAVAAVGPWLARAVWGHTYVRHLWLDLPRESWYFRAEAAAKEVDATLRSYRNNSLMANVGSR